MVESIELIKKKLILKKIVWKTKKIFNELVKEKYLEFQNLKEKMNPNSLIYKYKTEAISPKGFSNYQNVIDLFII